MERNIQRINGIKMDLGKLTDDELEANMGHAHLRISAASHDLEKLGIESARRFALAETALQDTVELPPLRLVPDPAQGTLFEHNPLPDPPEAA